MRAATLILQIASLCIARAGCIFDNLHRCPVPTYLATEFRASGMMTIRIELLTMNGAARLLLMSAPQYAAYIEGAGNDTLQPLCGDEGLFNYCSEDIDIEFNGAGQIVIANSDYRYRDTGQSDSPVLVSGRVVIEDGSTGTEKFDIPGALKYSLGVFVSSLSAAGCIAACLVWRERRMRKRSGASELTDALNIQSEILP